MTRATAARLLILAVLAGAVVVLVAWILLSLTGPTPVPRPASGGLGAPITLEQFKVGLGCRESDGDYDARNDRTGAIGKYQILPVNWRAWSGRWLGDRRADPTAENQELVSSKKLSELRRTLGNWAVVAHWWLTGSEEPDRTTWSAYANGYVDVVLAVARASQTMPGRATIPLSCFSTPADPFPAAPPTLDLSEPGPTASPDETGSATPSP